MSGNTVYQRSWFTSRPVVLSNAVAESRYAPAVSGVQLQVARVEYTCNWLHAGMAFGLYSQNWYCGAAIPVAEAVSVTGVLADCGEAGATFSASAALLMVTVPFVKVVGILLE